MNLSERSFRTVIWNSTAGDGKDTGAEALRERAPGKRAFSRISMAVEERAGTILIISSGKEQFQAVQPALALQYSRILHVCGLSEAKTLLLREAIRTIVIFAPVAGENAVGAAAQMVRKEGVSVLLYVNREIYEETVWHFRGEPVCVMQYPARIVPFLQAVGFMETMTGRQEALRNEVRRLHGRLQDQLITGRAKCLLIEKEKLSEDEAHHYLEKMAMNSGLSRTEAAQQVIRRYADGGRSGR